MNTLQFTEQEQKAFDYFCENYSSHQKFIHCQTVAYIDDEHLIKLASPNSDFQLFVSVNSQLNIVTVTEQTWVDVQLELKPQTLEELISHLKILQSRLMTLLNDKSEIFSRSSFCNDVWFLFKNLLFVYEYSNKWINSMYNVQVLMWFCREKFDFNFSHIDDLQLSQELMCCYSCLGKNPVIPKLDAHDNLIFDSCQCCDGVGYHVIPF